MLALGSYEKTLRAIGQDLERRRIKNFELLNHKTLILACDTSPEHLGKHRSPSERDDRNTRRPLWKRILGGNSKDASKREQGPKQFVYMKPDIEQLEIDGRARARTPGLRPDPGSLPESLRLIGARMDNRQANLVSISKSGWAFNARYATEEGKMREEEFGIDFLQKFSLHRYQERDPA